MDLSKIDDINELNALYVKHSEAFIAANQQVEVERQNVVAIRSRIEQLKGPSTADTDSKNTK